ncbi:MAG: hypothetical protein HZB18_14855 [Chloroflexi bacterium]|nr:hypothetical protein [Chloroflexota bacterium]
MSNDTDNEARIKALEQQINLLKNALGSFALGLDKVSQVQAGQTGVIGGLVQANETQAQYLKKLSEDIEKNNELLKRLLEKRD